ncbi:glycosyltransferase family 4 protein [Acinetobacter terrae]|uniref:Glycosyltransferase family 4 protein n=1 Tax=Acinetobacter terrae TaxID=2731247 RepID=A0A8E4FB37_9GAMM|nr:glycosyltransferase family 4 protein [Acinetobacter terrae]NNH38955.1 glycosyltransferase family 4 protein [Acinetobacter terrae]
MKLCFILNHLYTPGGIERAVSNRLSELSKDHDVYVLTTENGHLPFYFGKHDNIKYIDINIKFKRKDDGGFKVNLYNIFFSIILFIKLQVQILRINPDVTINVIGVHTLYFVPFLLRQGKTILEHHASIYQYPPSRLRKEIMKKFKYHIFLTEEEAKLADFIENKIVIPNPIKGNHQALIPFSSRKNKILAAGRIVEIKGFDRLILAWSLIQKKHQNWILEIYGDGDKKVLDDLEALISELNLSDTVFIKPATSNIVELMLESKIYAMTSCYESFGMVLLEAMSAGMLVVSFDCPTGPRNIIDDQVGFLVEDNNIELFSEKISEIILNEDKYLDKSENAYKKSLDYSVNSVNERWNNLFLSIK